MQNNGNDPHAQKKKEISELYTEMKQTMFQLMLIYYTAKYSIRKMLKQLNNFRIFKQMY